MYEDEDEDEDDVAMLEEMLAFEADEAAWRAATSGAREQVRTALGGALLAWTAWAWLLYISLLLLLTMGGGVR